MTLDTQLKRTTGTIYAGFMRDSRISLPDGIYITGSRFVTELMNRGVGVTANRRKMLQDLSESPYYGTEDNIWTGIQVLEYAPHVLSLYTFNPWKELMGGHILGENFPGIDYDRNKVFRAIVNNPREGVMIMRNMYALFTQLPKSIQEELLGIAQDYPCSFNMELDIILENPRDLAVDSKVRHVISRIVGSVRPKYKRDIKYILRLIAEHNICVGKGELVRRQIEDLVGFDIKTIPDHWEQGHLDERVIAQKRAELNELLQKQRIKNSKR